MTQQEYEKVKQECWEEYFKHVVCSTDNPKGWFERAFDRAYSLGKPNETITQEDVEKASMKYRDAHYDKFYDNLHNDRRTWDALEHTICASFISGAQFALGKQEKNTEMSKEKLMCLRDRTKVCNRCHACDIDTDAWYSMYSR